MAALDQTRRDFFDGCDLVVRAPGVFFLTGDYSVEVGQPSILIALDLWVYVGIKFNTTGKFKFSVTDAHPSAPLYEQNLVKYEKHYFKPNEHQDQRDFLHESLKNLNKGMHEWRKANNIKQTFDVKVWSDVPFAVGLNTCAALCSGLGMIMYSLEQNRAKKNSQKISPKILNKTIREFFTSDYKTLINNREFMRIFKLSRFCDDLFTDLFKSGATTFASLIRTKENAETVFYFTEARGLKTDFPTKRKVINYESEFEKLDKLKFFGNRLPIPSWLKAYGLSLVYCGKKAEHMGVIGLLYAKHSMETAESNRIYECLKKWFGQKELDTIGHIMPLSKIIESAGSKATEEVSTWPRHLYSATLGLIGWRLFQSLIAHDSKEDTFLKLIRDNNAMLKAYGVLDDRMNEFKQELRAKYLKKYANKYWAKTTGSGNGGDLIIIADTQSLDDINNKLCKEWNKNLKSRKPRYNNKGPQIHCSTAVNNKYTPTDHEPVFFPRRGHPLWEKPIANDNSDTKKAKTLVLLVNKPDQSIRLRAKGGNRGWKELRIDNPYQKKLLRALADKRGAPLNLYRIYDEFSEKSTGEKLGDSKKDLDKIVRKANNRVTSLLYYLSRNIKNLGDWFERSRFLKNRELEHNPDEHPARYKIRELNPDYVKVERLTSGKRIKKI